VTETGNENVTETDNVTETETETDTSGPQPNDFVENFIASGGDVADPGDVGRAIIEDVLSSDTVQGAVSDTVDAWKDSTANATEEDVTDPYA
jgi:hypothetical protein